jgi:hypothetical protein
MEIWLAVVIGITQLLLGGMGVYVSLRVPKREHHRHWLLAFVGIGMTGVALTGWLSELGSKEQERNAATQGKMAKDIEATRQALQSSLLEQARMSAHLEDIQTIMDNLRAGGLTGMTQMASALTILTKAPPQNSEELRQSATDLITKLRRWKLAVDDRLTAAEAEDIQIYVQSIKAGGPKGGEMGHPIRDRVKRNISDDFSINYLPDALRVRSAILANLRRAGKTLPPEIPLHVHGLDEPFTFWPTGMKGGEIEALAVYFEKLKDEISFP